jgi:hypothetical protein
LCAEPLLCSFEVASEVVESATASSTGAAASSLVPWVGVETTLPKEKLTLGLGAAAAAPPKPANPEKALELPETALGGIKERLIELEIVWIFFRPRRGLCQQRGASIQ